MQKVGVVSVDSGQIILSDTCYLNNHKGICCKKPTQLNHIDGRPGSGVCITGFGGDGNYPVYVIKDKNGIVKEVKIIFRVENENN